MAGPAVILREIHRLRTHARDLQDRIDNAPRQLRLQKNAVARYEETLHQAHDAIKHLKVGIHEKEVSVKSIHASIKKYEQQLNDITSKKEYDALRHEITAVRDKIRVIEDEALTLMGEVEEKTAEVPKYEAALKQAKAEFAEFERDYQQRLDSWVKQRDDVDKKVADEEVKLPPDIRVQYERVIKSMGADALAGVDGRICTACYTEITAQLAHNLHMEQVVVCRSCGRYLYLKDAG
jgi:predicted  nucleic acid-binding Zn-ribbon protein